MIDTQRVFLVQFRNTVCLYRSMFDESLMLISSDVRTQMPSSGHVCISRHPRR